MYNHSLHVFLQRFSDLRVISAETVPVRMFSGNQYGNHEITYTWNRGEQKEFWLFVLRLYLTGDIDIPPPDVILPPFLAKKGNANCCCVMWRHQWRRTVSRNTTSSMKKDCRRVMLRHQNERAVVRSCDITAAAVLAAFDPSASSELAQLESRRFLKWWLYAEGWTYTDI